MRRTRFTEREHRGVMFRDCRRPCIGGRVFWGPAEPKWRGELGYVGICSHCGWQVFTAELLGHVAAPTPAPIRGQRRGEPPLRLSRARVAA